ncbi:hypothetical protein J5619_23040, partial [Enterobacter ludwigii]|nr:hypothetical protein [Enterobacter ludwigii]
MVLANRCHRQNMKTSIINGSEVSRLSVAIHSGGFCGDSVHGSLLPCYLTGSDEREADLLALYG